MAHIKSSKAHSSSIDPHGLYRLSSFLPHTGISRTSWYRRMEEKKAPRPAFKYSRRVSVWRGADILRWLEDPMAWSPDDEIAGDTDKFVTESKRPFRATPPQSSQSAALAGVCQPCGNTWSSHKRRNQSNEQSIHMILKAVGPNGIGHMCDCLRPSYTSPIEAKRQKESETDVLKYASVGANSLHGGTQR